MVTRPSDRFVSRAHTSQQLILIPLMLCFGCSFPIDYLAVRVETGGEWWESGSVRACAVEVFSTLAGCGQLDHQFEFLSTARLKFQPLKIEGNKRLGLSKQPLRVFFFPTLSLFFLSQFLCPGLGSALTDAGMIANVIMSKYFTPKTVKW